MAGPSPSPSPPPATTITDLNEDAFAHCATFLTPRDVCNLAMTSTALNRLAYSDSIWQHFFTERWNQQIPHPSSSQWNGTGARKMYLARRTDLHQFRFHDPLVLHIHAQPKPFTHLLLDQNHVFAAQGSVVEMINLDAYQKGSRDAVHTLSDHKARITCMRLFSHNEMSLLRGETQGEKNVLVTSSCDHSIRLWWKLLAEKEVRYLFRAEKVLSAGAWALESVSNSGSCLRSLRGHNGPVLSLSNKLLGEGNNKVLASGGEDGTVRLWSLGSSGKRGQRALKATFYGHEKPVNFLSVAGHKTSLLVSMSRDSKVRVWDTATSSAVRSSCCVGMTSFLGAPISMKCHESLLYVAAGSSVTAVDLRTMQKVITVAAHQSKLYSFDALPSKSLICTGGDGSAMLWDIRRNQESAKPEPIAELDWHRGPVTMLHMDPYKIVTGGVHDEVVRVGEVDTGVQTMPLLTCLTADDFGRSGCDAMAVDGCRAVTACCCEDRGLLRFWDFNNATKPIMKIEDYQPSSSRFWGPDSDCSSDDE